MIGAGSDSRFGYPLEIALGVGETHWIVSDYDLEKVSVCTPSRDCVRLHMHVVGCVCVWNFETKFF